MANQFESFKLIDLPKTFYNSDTHEPLSHCIMCERHLLQDGVPYMIEKAIKQHPELNFSEPIFEYAMCMDCAVKMNNALSEESRMRISAYFMEHVDFEARRLRLQEENADAIDHWTTHCVIKNTPITGTREYQLVAQCVGRKLQMSSMPFALSLEAMEEMSLLLSEKSKGEMDDFIDRYFSGPPEVAALLRNKFVMI